MRTPGQTAHQEQQNGEMRNAKYIKIRRGHHIYSMTLVLLNGGMGSISSGHQIRRTTLVHHRNNAFTVFGTSAV